VRDGVDVKLLPDEQELYVLARSRARINKERAMRRRKLKWLWGRLKELSAMRLKREELLMKLGAARDKARAAWRLLDIEVDPQLASFSYALNRDKLRKVRRREGRYLLRTNLSEHQPEKLWTFYIQLTEIDIDLSWRLSRLLCEWGGGGVSRRSSPPRHRGCEDCLQGRDLRNIGMEEFGTRGADFDDAAA
jgi:hypothetical protein